MIMRRQSLLPVLASLCLLSLGAIARAEDAPPSLDEHPLAERCHAEPEKCREARDKWQAWCKENPTRCDEMKQRHQKMREECAKDPKACAEKRKEMRERAEQRRKEHCKDMPAQHHDDKPTSQDAPAPNAPPASN